eukprot:evm.model.scf_345.2 EVM.evm.TU.scf_345.2   scf_345:33857-40216(+)
MSFAARPPAGSPRPRRASALRQDQGAVRLIPDGRRSSRRPKCRAADQNGSQGSATSSSAGGMQDAEKVAEAAVGIYEDEEDFDVDDMSGTIDAAGAGKSNISPGWLTQLGRLWGGESDCPVVNAAPEDIQDLLGGALFQAVFKYFQEAGPVYLLPTGPVSSFLVISNPECAKHVLKLSDNPKRGVYNKGLVAEVSQFLFGDGFAVAGGEHWRRRRKAVSPALHRSYLEAMIERVFSPSAHYLNAKLRVAARSGQPINMEASLTQLTLDVVGKAVFNYDFDSLKGDSPLIQAVYNALKETEQRATDLLPIWKLPMISSFIPRQKKALESVQLIRAVTEDLIRKCKVMVDAEGDSQFGEGYMNESDPSVLRFLLASREEVTSTQLRDDLLSMLVAGHETTGSALTWALYLLVQNPDKMEKAVEEINQVMGDRENPTLADYQKLRYITLCMCESLRLFPHPPVLLRRAAQADVLPGGYKVPVGQDVMISIYNVHHNPDVWENAEDFIPERFGMEGPVPNESNTDYKFIPFSGGPRKCVGDQFALMEAVVALAVILREFDFSIVPDQEIGMTTGATIHTTNGLYMNVVERKGSGASRVSTEETLEMAAP